MLLPPVASDAAVQARLARHVDNAGGVITLDIESDGASSDAQPDLAPLQRDFVVLGSASQSETSFINGRRSDRMRWSVRLQPRHPGNLVIPAITVGSEQTAALDVDAGAVPPQVAAQLATHVFVEVEGGAAAGRSVYVQQQTPYTVRLYYDDTIQKGQLDAPNPADAVVEQLGADKKGTAVRDGRSFNVLERTYAIAPEKSGTLTIPPVSFSGSQVLPQDEQAQAAPPGDDAGAGDDLFSRMLRQSPLGNDPMFRGFAGGQATQPVSVQGKALVLQVRPRPAAAQANWLPAEAVVLHDSWQDHPPELKAGEPATRTITVQAKGLSASQIPPLTFAQPADARVYTEAAENQSRTDGKTIFGISTQKVTYIPNAQGTLDVPAVELTWWDVGSDASRQAILPAATFVVAPGVAGAAVSPESAVRPAPVHAGPALTTGSQPPSGTASAGWGWQGHRVQFLIVALLTALLVALAVAIRRRKDPAPGAAGSNRGAAGRLPSRTGSLRALRRACAADDRDAARSALLDLAQTRWHDDPPRGLGALAARLGQGAAEVRSLERSLYADDDTSPWRGDALWRAMRRGLHPRRADTARLDDGLRDLYPSTGQRSPL